MTWATMGDGRGCPAHYKLCMKKKLGGRGNHVLEILFLFRVHRRGALLFRPKAFYMGILDLEGQPSKLKLLRMSFLVRLESLAILR